MKVLALTRLSEQECRKRIDNDAKELQNDAQHLCNLEDGKGSLLRRSAYKTLKKTMEAQMFAAKLAGSTIDWKQIINTMRLFTTKPPFGILSFESGDPLNRVVMDIDELYMQYIGFAKMKYSAGAERKEMLKSVEKALKAESVEEIVEAKDNVDQ